MRHVKHLVLCIVKILELVLTHYKFPKRGDIVKNLNLLAVDLGASSGRCIVGTFDGNKINLEEIHRFDNNPITLSHTLYWDMPLIFEEIKQGMSNVQEEVASLGVDTWGVDFGIVDTRGRLVSNPIHYRDERTNHIPEILHKKITEQELYKKTGIQPMQINTIFQLYSMVYNRSPLLDHIDKLLFMPDLINYFLTGIKATEYSIASTSSLLDPYERQWNIEILNKLGFNEKWFTPEIVSSGTVLGALSSNILGNSKCNTTKVISTASHDTASAVVSVPISQEYSAYISCGTWSLIGVEIKEPIIDEYTSKVFFTNERGIDDTVRLLKNITGLWVLQECRRYWQSNGEEISYPFMVEMAEKIKENKSFIDLSDHTFLSPGNMPNKIKDYCLKTKQHIPNNKAEMIRCIIESLACTYKKMVDELETAIKHPISVIHMVGGGAQNSLLCEITANLTKKTVIAGPVEASSMGNILTQMKALGEAKGLSELRQIVKNSCTIIEYSPKDKAYWEDVYYKFSLV
ncbi:Rhamnulokinase [Pelosinus sp. UFO1]|nr:Rhamnulokinase [Pelosinus sp. UFO1]